MLKTILSVALLLAASLSAAPALAQLDVGDVALRVEAGAIQTGLVDEVTGEAVFPRRVFVAQLDATLFTNEPGFDSEPGVFAPASSLAFDILTNLRVWNGADFSAASPSQLRIRFGGLERLTPIDDTLVTGFSLSVAADGTWHRHLGYTLMAPADPGVYLLNLALRSSDPAVGASEPFWLVIGNAADTAVLEAAFNWARDNLVNPPCAADFNRDGLRNPDDLSEFITCFFVDVQFPGACGQSDFNGDALRNPDDLSEFITAFFLGC